MQQRLADRLKELEIYSLQRRRERYMILYLYKIIITAVPNPGLDINYNIRTKINVRPKSCNLSVNWVKKARTSSFFFQGPRLQNSLPLELRELENIAIPEKKHVDIFKRKLDSYLETIPDNPGSLRNSLCPMLLYVCYYLFIYLFIYCLFTYLFILFIQLFTYLFS